MTDTFVFLASRFAGALVTLVLGSLVVFVVMKAAPGDPALIALGDFATPEAIEAFNAEHGLDRSLVEQYGSWLSRVAVFDFGQSMTIAGGQNISDLLAFRLPNTFFIGIFALTIAVGVSLVVGISAATWQGTAIDTTATSAATLGISMPDFWLAYMLVLVFSIELGLFPSYGFSGFGESPVAAIHSGFLPSLAIAAPMAAVFSRTLRAAILENIAKDYVLVGQSFGFGNRFLMVHYVLRNSLIPYIVVVGLQVRYLLGGVVIIERIFGINGIGSLMVDAAFARDYFVVQACTLLFLTIVLGVNLLVDITCVLLDPKQRG